MHADYTRAGAAGDRQGGGAVAWAGGCVWGGGGGGGGVFSCAICGLDWGLDGVGVVQG